MSSGRIGNGGRDGGRPGVGSPGGRGRGGRVIDTPLPLEKTTTSAAPPTTVATGETSLGSVNATSFASASFVDGDDLRYSMIYCKVVPPLKEGVMWKKGHLKTGWKQRYFVLTQTLLTYYENSSKSDIKGKLVPADACIKMCHLFV